MPFLQSRIEVDNLITVNLILMFEEKEIVYALKFLISVNELLRHSPVNDVVQIGFLYL